MDISSVKTEIKAWERDFKRRLGREPTVQDIKQHPPIGLYPIPSPPPPSHNHHQPTSTDSTRNSQRHLPPPPLFPTPAPRKPPPPSHPSTPSPPRRTGATTPLPISCPTRPHPMPFPEPANVSEASPSLPLPTKESVPGSALKHCPTRRPAVKTMTSHTLHHFSSIPLSRPHEVLNPSNSSFMIPTSPQRPIHLPPPPPFFERKAHLTPAVSSEVNCSLQLTPSMTVSLPISKLIELHSSLYLPNHPLPSPQSRIMFHLSRTILRSVHCPYQTQKPHIHNPPLVRHSYHPHHPHPIHQFVPPTNLLAKTQSLKQQTPQAGKRPRLPSPLITLMARKAQRILSEPP